MNRVGKINSGLIDKEGKKGNFMKVRFPIM